MEGIQQMFAEIMGYDRDRHDDQLTIWCHLKRQSEADRIASRTSLQWASIRRAKKRWQAKHRDVLRAADARWRASLPPDECWCRKKKAPGKSLCAKHLEANRLRAARYAAEKKAKRQEARAA